MIAAPSNRSMLALAGTVSVAVALTGGRVGASGEPDDDDPTPEPQIIGGDPADPGEYPFMAAILDDTIPGNDYAKQFCGGALINSNWVLTAAHCVEGASAGDLAVAVGRTTLSSNQGERRDISEVHVHPQFGSPVQFAHDAALLKLASPINNITPIPVATGADNTYEAPGTPLTVIGWGNTRTSPPPSYPDNLMEVTVSAVGDQACTNAYGSSLHQPTMLCAADPGEDSCQGDSGGPLFATKPGGSRVHMGIVSWGNGCALPGFPGVYAESNNTAIRDWISDTSSGK